MHLIQVPPTPRSFLPGTQGIGLRVGPTSLLPPGEVWGHQSQLCLRRAQDGPGKSWRLLPPTRATAQDPGPHLPLLVMQGGGAVGTALRVGTTLPTGTCHSLGQHSPTPQTTRCQLTGSPQLWCPQASTTEGAQRAQRLGCYFVKGASFYLRPQTKPPLWPIQPWCCQATSVPWSRPQHPWNLALCCPRARPSGSAMGWAAMGLAPSMVNGTHSCA